MISKRLIELGVMAFRQKNVRGTFKPHFSVKFRSPEDGSIRVFSVDTTRTPQKYPQPDAYLITHAHSDHHGKSAMLSERSICSDKTAVALEIRHGKKYKGSTVKVNESINVNGVTVKTYPTGHTAGSIAFFWENDVGTRILVTGDVKDASELPECDVLITEANYGDPSDLTCYFEDDTTGFRNALNGGGSVAFGAYAFGKAQRTVGLLRDFGYSGTIEMESKSLELTQELIEDSGGLVGLGESSGERVCVVPPWDLGKLPSDITKYVLTGRSDYRYPTIHISDHLDAQGLLDMVMAVSPQITIVYHPSGHRPERFAAHLNSIGIESVSIDRINNVLSNEFI
ncbi:MAG: MBL fold metallo-hydrolase [Methanosarcinaceae archaeon]|nr:MBL fold metallo-hydrolase [Methanosarcinaceae archaeon]